MMDLFQPSKSVQLYPVQEYILSELRKTISYHKRTVLMAPTGLGKTQIAIEIIKRALSKNKKCCFVCHRITLVEQTSSALYSQGIRHGVLQGNHPDFFPDRPVQVCSIQTLARRGTDGFDIFFFDEIQVFFKAHKKIMDHNPDAFFIALSATPFTRGLGKHFTALCNPVSLKDLIEQKRLKRYDIYGPCPIDLTGVRTVSGDWKRDDLEEAADKPKLVADIVQTWIRLARNRKTIVFSSGVGHSRSLEKEFKKNGIKAVEVNGYMSKESTDFELGANQIIEDFRNGKHQVIISVEMLVAGFDVTDVSCVVFATSTKSMMKFSQAVGRGLRKHDGIDDCIVLDHGRITETLGFPCDYEFIHLDDGKHHASKSNKKEKPEQLPKKCPSCEFLKPSGVRKCPACKFEPKHLEDIETEKGELEKLQRKTRSQYTLAEKQSFMAQLNQHCRDSGGKIHYKGFYGAAVYAYADKFGCKPSSKMKWDAFEPVGDEVRKFMLHRNIKYAKSKQKGEQQ